MKANFINFPRLTETDMADYTNEGLSTPEVSHNEWREELATYMQQCKMSSDKVTGETTFQHEHPSPRVITLDVGGRNFRALKITLEESPNLRQQLSGNWQAYLQEDGSLFLDSEPDIFEHLLRYMRRPNIFPLFWTKTSGFDYNLYTRLQAEAEVYGLTDLSDWIKNEEYTKAIQIIAPTPMVMNVASFSPHLSVESLRASRREFEGDGSTTLGFHVVTKAEEYFDCPISKPNHKVPRGEEIRCGAQCRMQENFDSCRYVKGKEYYEVVIVPTCVDFDSDVCMRLA